MTFLKFLSAAALLTTVALAGCADEVQPDDSADTLQCESANQNRLGVGERGELSSVPTAIDFQPTSPGSVASETVEIVNQGHGRLHITGMDIVEAQSADSDGEREFFRGETGWELGPVTLEPGESHEVSVEFRPSNPSGDRGAIVVTTECAESATYEVPIEAPALEPNLDAPRQVAFGRVPVQDDQIWQGEQRSFQAQNVGGGPLHIDDVHVSGSENFRVTYPRPTDEEAANGSLGDPDNDATEWPRTVAPGESFPVRVWFKPDDNLPETAELIFVTNDPDEPHYVIELSGQSQQNSDNICPTAVAKAWVQGTNRPQTTVETIPLNTIILDGSQSSDPDGTVVEYQWTILSTPQGSTQRLLPDSSSNSPRVFLDLAGTYEIELRVRDDDGAYNCNRAIVTIIAGGAGGVHVQLVWSTPGDIDQTDTLGTDLDLHYKHRNGYWNEEPWDIFGMNPTADWGMLGDSSDDPRLDIDDTDGAGPENINHSGLENLTYRIGVYYRTDHGLGASYATVRVYLGGSLVFELENKYLGRAGEFWDVATIEWPSATVSAVDEVHEGFPDP